MHNKLNNRVVDSDDEKRNHSINSGNRASNSDFDARASEMSLDSNARGKKINSDASLH